MWLNFTVRARRTLVDTCMEADRLMEQTSPWHLLVALASARHGMARLLLDRLKLSEADIRSALAPLPRDKRVPSTPSQLSREIETILLLAAQEAHELNHSYVGVEHLLLGILRHAESPASSLLREHGASVEQTRAWIETFLQAVPDPESAGTDEASGGRRD